uniref:Uncharacterized protein n=1 Tax=Panagrolaimus sp. ES5 TaxID=591445 RepID=A0AC34G477_9BILA
MLSSRSRSTVARTPHHADFVSPENTMEISGIERLLDPVFLNLAKESAIVYGKWLKMDNKRKFRERRETE